MAQDKQGAGLNGQINIPEGRFHAYGRDLIVRKGELLFSGPPDQPLLNIEAIRNPDATEDDVIAPACASLAPPMNLRRRSSRPGHVAAGSALYLLRGGVWIANRRWCGNDINVSRSGVAQSGQVVGKIGETFGVSNLALDTQGVGDSSQVVVSGYVLPGLQVKYGVGSLTL